MVRAVVLAILAVSGMGACKGGDDAPQVQPGVAAGTIVELVGTVTATRGGETRTLAAADTISGDDVIQTGADGRVVITLTHNNARWELGPNRHGPVAGSPAWSMARQAVTTTNLTEATTAAGRHAERSGADTAATSASASSKEEAAAAPAAEPTLDRGPAPDPVAPRKAENRERAEPVSKGGQIRPAVPTPPRSPSPSPPPPPRDLQAPGGGDAAPSPVVGGASQGVRRLDAKERAPVDGGSSSGARTFEEDADTLAPKPKTLASEVRAALVREKAAIDACLTTTAAEVAVTLTVANGKARFVTRPVQPASVGTCLAAIAGRLTFTIVAGTTSVRVAR